MSETKARPTIGVFGHYGVGNLGDEAIIASVIQALQRYLPEAELICFSLNVEDSARRHGVRAYPIRRLHRATDEQVTGDEGKDRVVESVCQRAKNALKCFPTLVAIRRGIGCILSFARNCIPESYFLFKAYRQLKGVDALFISGSGQLNDSYDGAKGFPYTLLKVAFDKTYRHAIGFCKCRCRRGRFIAEQTVPALGVAAGKIPFLP